LQGKNVALDKTSMKDTLEKLLETENVQLTKLNDIVLKAIEEEKLLSQKLYEFEDKHPPFTSRLADKVASFGGSWKFIAVFALFMLLWMLANVYFLSRPFDAYPFILLNLILSTIAAIQAPIIMMSQNRKEEKDRQRAINDYLINLKAEIEIRHMHQKIDLLISEQMKTLFDIQKAQVELMEDIKTGITSNQYNDSLNKAPGVQ
jgi:uncharacterized membrane protein